MLSQGALAIAYAYLSPFIILGIIVGLVALASRLIERRALATPGAETAGIPPPTPSSQQPAAAESSEALLREVVAAAVAAVAAHLAAQPVAPARVTSAPPQSVVTGWVYRWRAQVSTSLNEFSVLKALRRK